MLKELAKGLAVGAVVGGACGLAFAPRSGKETREKIKQEVDENTAMVEDLTTSLTNFQVALSNLQTQVDELVPSFAKETNQTFANFKFQATPRIVEIEQQLTKIQDELPKENE